MTEPTPPNPAPILADTAAATAAAVAPTEAGFSVDAGATNLKDAFLGYVTSIRSGEVGALPAVAGLVVLLLVFSTTTKIFLTRGNLANLPTQAAPTILIGMGLVFVLLLGEIDLSAGTAAGLASAGMAIAVNFHGNLETQLKGGMFGAYIAVMVLALVVAVRERLWPGVLAIVFGGVILVTHIGSSQVLAMLLAVTTGTSIGILTGFLRARVGIPSFVVTLALFLAWQGVLIQFLGAGNSFPTQRFKTINALENTNISPLWSWVVLIVFVGGYGAFTLYTSIKRRAQQLSAQPVSIVVGRFVILAVLGAFSVFFLNKNRNPNKGLIIRGLPWVVLLILIVLVAMTLLLSKTTFGRHLYASGGNAEAARRAGIDVPRMRIAAFGISSTLAAIGGVVLASKQGGVPADAGGGNTLLFAVGAAVVGGTSLFGGRGRVRDAVLGGLVITIIPNGLQLHPNVGASYQYVITGGFLLVAAAVDALSRTRRPT